MSEEREERRGRGRQSGVRPRRGDRALVSEQGEQVGQVGQVGLMGQVSE